MGMISSKQLRIIALPTWRSAVKHMRVNSLLRNSIYIMTTTALTGSSGYLFWILAAHMYPPKDVGLASALIGTMMLAATLANLGIGPALIQTLPRMASGEAWSLSLNAVFMTGLFSSLVTGTVAAIALPFLSPKLTAVGHEGSFVLTLIAGVPLLTLASLLDSTFTAERAAGNMLARTAAFALMRIPLLVIPVLFGQVNALLICIAWILAAGISVVTGAFLIARLKRAYRLTIRGVFKQLRAMLSLVAGHQFISFGALAPIYLLPVIVVARLSLAENAYFYTSWQVGSLFFMVSPSVATALLAEGSHTSSDILRKARSSVLIISALLCPPMLLALLGGHLILSLFGPDYALYGYSLLTVLVISALPDALTNVYVAVLRVQNRLKSAAFLNLGMAAITLILAWVLLPRMGIVGVGWAWLIAQTTGTVVVLVRLTGMLVDARTLNPRAWSRNWSRNWSRTWRSISASSAHYAATAASAAHATRASVTARWGARRARARKRIERILVVVDPCSAGESLRIRPYVAMIRQDYPHAHITLLANADALTGLESLDEIDRLERSDLYTYRPYPQAITALLQIWAWRALVWRLGVGYDRVITFYWGGVLQHALGFVVCRGQRVGYAHYPAPLSRWLLTDHLGPFHWRESHPPQHEALLRTAGVEGGKIGRPAAYSTPNDAALVARLLRTYGIADDDRLFVLHPGSDWACQQWLRTRWSELADALVDRYHATIVFTGSASEAGYVEGIQRGMRASSHSLVGKTTLAQLAALLSRSALCVCVDSAVFELSQVATVPTVTLAGPSRPDTGLFGAFLPVIVHRMDDELADTIIACQTGHNALHEPGCWNYDCPMSGLRDITVAHALDAVEVQLGRDDATPQIEARASVACLMDVAELATSAGETPQPHTALVELFEAFDLQHIRWLLLRGELELATPTGDVDLLIDPRDMARARHVLEARHYLFLPTCGRGTHQFYTSYHAATDTWITLDIVTEMTYGRYLNLRSHLAIGRLAHRQRLGSVYVFAQSDRFWALFLHCVLDKGWFAPHRATRLCELAPTASAKGPLARQVAMACPDGWDPARLIASVTLGEWDMLTQLAPRLYAGWQRREPMRARWLSGTNRALQLVEIPLSRLRRPGLSVALLGPDGAGKSSLTAALERSFQIPVRAVYMGLWKNERTKPDTQGLDLGLWLAGRGLDISARLPKAWARYLLGLWHRTLGRVVIFDRYVYDALISAQTSSGRLKQLYMRVLGHACPAPDLVLVLDAPGEVMFARKGEHSPEELEIQRQSLLALRHQIPHVQVVDVTRDEETVRSEVFSRIWDACRARWSRDDTHL